MDSYCNTQFAVREEIRGLLLLVEQDGDVQRIEKMITSRVGCLSVYDGSGDALTH